MKHFAWPLAGLLVVLQACSHGSPSQPTPTPTAKISSIERNIPQPVNALKGEEAAIKARAARIEAELKALDRDALPDGHWAKEFAGRYYEGDGLGTNAGILIAPESGAAYLNYGCLGLYGGNHGDIVEVLPDGLRLKLALPADRDIMKFLDDRMYFVRWGERRYLVPASEMLRLVNNYNEGGFARESMYGIPRLQVPGVHPRDWDEPVPPGRPELPPQYARLLRDAPITLKVTKVSPVEVKPGFERCTIEFEGGTDTGVFEGMEFRYPVDTITGGEVVTITRADATTCTGELVGYMSYGESLQIPAVGETVEGLKELVWPSPTASPAPK